MHGQPRVLVLNDTGRTQHPGCVLVMRRIAAGCSAAGMQVAAMLSLGTRFRGDVRRHVPNCDIVVINGEGTLHDDAPGALLLRDAALYASDCGRLVALINTVWERNRIVDDMLGCAFVVAARESLSAAAIKRTSPMAEILVVPDLTLSTDEDILFASDDDTTGSQPVVIDSVRQDVSLLLAKYARSRGLDFIRMAHRPSSVDPEALFTWFRILATSKWRSQFRLHEAGRLRPARVIVTGRFHGACLAILARRPFVAIPSNSYKLQGLLRDAKLGECAVMLSDSDLAGDTGAAIDAAVARVNSAMAGPLGKAAYERACQAYARVARSGASSLFQLIAAHGRRAITS